MEGKNETAEKVFQAAGRAFDLNMQAAAKFEAVKGELAALHSILVDLASALADVPDNGDKAKVAASVARTAKIVHAVGLVISNTEEI